ncbi:hybrid sensor histidine kinase/response regulator [bacterium]|nr:MAG: hybrid sensor histidine kinase/response regulator [bacterium]
MSYFINRSEYLVRHYTIEDGLPVNSVNGMIQDENGYLYLSTYDGLASFDGYQFRIYNSGNTEGMLSNRIVGIMQDAQKGLWLLNDNLTLTLKEGTQFTSFLPQQLPGDVNRIFEDSRDNIYVIGLKGIARYNRFDKQFINLTAELLNVPTYVIGQGKTDEIILVNENGLISLKHDKPHLLLPASEFPLYNDDILGLILVGDTIWMGGSDGFFGFNTISNQIEHVYTERNFTVWSLYNNNDSLLTITANNGFYHFTPSSKNLKKLPLEINSFIARTNLVFEGADGEQILIGDDEVVIDGQTALTTRSIKFGFLDESGSLWIGTESNGLYQLQKSTFVNIGEKEIPSFSNMYSIIEDNQQHIWASGYGGGIFRLSDSGISNWNSTNSALTSDIIKFVFQDSKGTVFAGVNNEGLWKFVDGDWEPITQLDDLETTTPEAMLEVNGTYFIGTLSSLIVWDNTGFNYFDSEQSLAFKGVQVLKASPKNIIYAGTNGEGVTRIQGAHYRRYTQENGSATSNIIRDIYVQSEDTLWLVTENLGLDRLIVNANGDIRSLKNVSMIDGLPQNSLHRLIPDRFGNFWISGNKGIIQISLNALNDYLDGLTKELRFISFDERDGLITREANGGVQSAGILTSSGKLWFPNQEGITITDPKEHQQDSRARPPTPIIVSCEINGAVYSTFNLTRFELPDHQRNFTVNLTAPNYVFQDRLQLSYKLSGVTDQWQTANKSRQAVFTSIPPGNHILTVKAQFIGGKPVETQFLLIAPPFFYETFWFKIAAVLCFFGFVYGGFRVRINRLILREQQLQERVDEQTKELRKADEQKSRFFTGITHELKTPLSLIIGPLSDLLDDTTRNYPDYLTQRLSVIESNSKRLQQLIDQILDVSKLNADAIHLKIQPMDLPAFTNQIIGQFQSRWEQEDISVSIKEMSFNEPIYVAQDAWERIIINIMTNAIKFSPPKSHITVSFQETEATVSVHIADEGPGIAPEHQTKVFEYLYQIAGSKSPEGTGIGLYLVKGLMTHMGGSIILKSDGIKGAEFILTLRKGYAHIEPHHTILHEVHNPASLTRETPVKTEELQIGTNAERTETVLVVEDNSGFREYLQSILSEQYTVLLAQNGKHALEILETETPQLIISDIMMPEMDGLELATQLRTQEKFEHLPMIFLSAKNQDSDRLQGLSSGADIYLTKPIRSTMLLSQIAAVLRREHILMNKEFKPLAPNEPALVASVRELVFRQLANPVLSVNMIADALNMSRAKLYSEWKKYSEVSVNDFIKSIRLEEANTLLRSRNFNVQEAARAVGFTDANYFSTSFKKYFHINPSQIDE